MRNRITHHSEESSLWPEIKQIGHIVFQWLYSINAQAGNIIRYYADAKNGSDFASRVFNACHIGILNGELYICYTSLQIGAEIRITVAWS